MTNFYEQAISVTMGYALGNIVDVGINMFTSRITKEENKKSKIKIGILLVFLAILISVGMLSV